MVDATPSRASVQDRSHTEGLRLAAAAAAAKLPPSLKDSHMVQGKDRRGGGGGGQGGSEGRIRKMDLDACEGVAKR